MSDRDGLRCLVVDDEPRLRQVLVRLMAREGFRCDEAPDGVEALEKLAGEEYVLVLSDLRMPRMDGLELLRNIQEKHRDVAVILITAVAEIEIALSALAMGAMDYLTKPFLIEVVHARVGQALEKRRLVLENRRYQQELEDRVAEQARHIEALFLGGVQAVVHALEVKDPYTSGHSIRVGRFSMLMARHLGLDDDTIRQIELGGHVHDIGKIGVRESILNKEGPLTDAEYAHIMTHPVVGWQILSPLLTDAPLALSIVRSHHERYDGNGVPDGLRGELIPLEARIAIVTDAFDAMTNRRAYRRGMNVASALSELQKHRGTQFDPAMVAEFVALVDNGTIVIPSVGERDRLTPATAHSAV